MSGFYEKCACGHTRYLHSWVAMSGKQEDQAVIRTDCQASVYLAHTAPNGGR